MYSIGYDEYLDKVYGCWLGKCISGTIGAPYEGMKQLLDFDYDPVLIENMLPNDDLDLQVLWLDVLEDKGRHFTADDLAEGFQTKCPYAMGEYAVFKKNHGRRIAPPFCGSYNNHFYLEGMGCPIRSEIWACIAPGDPDLAAACAAKDGVLDHAGNSVWAEQFLAAAEALAFFETDLDRIYDQALAFVPRDSRLYRLIADTRRWCAGQDDWKVVREWIIRDYGHPDCTNLFQNMGFTVLALHYGKGDFLDTTMIALNCGFDTDCTCATAGALLGIMAGGKALEDRHGFQDFGYKLGVHVERRSELLYDLAEDTCRMGLEFLPLNGATVIEGGPAVEAIPAPDLPPVGFSVDYLGDPVIGMGETKAVRLSMCNNTEGMLHGQAWLRAPEGWETGGAELAVDLAAGEQVEWDVVVTAPDGLPMLSESNLLTVGFAADGGSEVTKVFGLAGAVVWECFGPYWENNVTVPPLKPGEGYWGPVTEGCATEAESIDRVRDYHLNAFAPKEAGADPEAYAGALRGTGRRVNIPQDRFPVSGLVGWTGPCDVVLARRLIAPEARTVQLNIGHSDAYALWVNGKCVSQQDAVAWWTPENVHVAEVELREGENDIVWRLSRRGAEAVFSLIYTEKLTCGAHYVDFASANPSGS